MIATYTAWRATADRWSLNRAWFFIGLASGALWAVIVWGIWAVFG